MLHYLKKLEKLPQCWRLRQERQQKIFQGGGNRNKDRKIAKTGRKIALLSLFQRGGATDKNTENSTIKAFILYLYHAW